MASSVLTRSSIVTSLPKTANTVVTLFGWAGARDVHLAKYSALYEKRGFTTVRFTAPFNGGGPSTLKNSRDLTGLMDNMRSVLSNPDKRIILHLLSMNGIYTLCSFILQYPELKLLERTSGILFDSCPIYTDNGAVEAISQVMDFSFFGQLPPPSTSDIIKYRIWKVYRLIQIRIGMIQTAIYKARGGDLRKISEYHFLRDLSTLPKHLSFIYSDGDTICKSYMIDQFHEYVSKKGHNVDALHLTDSLHVEHLRTHRGEYEAVIDRLLTSIDRDDTFKSKL